jgi:hypothetical protein
VRVISLKGKSPESIKNRIDPRAKISIPKVIIYPSKISGAI